MYMKSSGRPTRKKSASNTQVVVRMTHEERDFWNEKALKKGFKTVSEMIRTLVEAA